MVAGAAARALYLSRRPRAQSTSKCPRRRAAYLLLRLSRGGDSVAGAAVVVVWWVLFLVNVVPATNTNQPTQKPQLDRPHQIKPQLCVVISPRFIAGRLLISNLILGCRRSSTQHIEDNYTCAARV